MKQSKRPRHTYESPKVIPLGDLAAGLGQTSCHSGASASNCSVGTIASNNCNNGTTAGQRCNVGTTANNCSTGLTAGP